MNEFMVGLNGENVVIMRRVPPVINKQEAINLAVWLVAIADDMQGDDGGEFKKQLKQAFET